MKFENKVEHCQSRAFGYDGVRSSVDSGKPYNVTVVCGDRQSTLVTGESGSGLRVAASEFVAGFCVGCENKIGAAALLALPRPEDAGGQ